MPRYNSKICRGCHKRLPLDQFDRWVNSLTGRIMYRYVCHACRRKLDAGRAQDRKATKLENVVGHWTPELARTQAILVRRLLEGEDGQPRLTKDDVARIRAKVEGAQK